MSRDQLSFESDRLPLEIVLGSLPERPQAKELEAARDADVRAGRFEFEARLARHQGLETTAAAFEARAKTCRSEALELLGVRIETFFARAVRRARQRELGR